MTLKEERILKEALRIMVRESLENENLEAERRTAKDREFYHKIRRMKKNAAKSQDFATEKNSKKVSKNKRAIVIKWLKDPMNNCAAIMKDLWHPDKKEEDSARSYFYKCRDGKLNDSGEPYKFSDEDINALYNIKSNKES